MVPRTPRTHTECVRVLIVGASGYVGGRLVPLLVRRADKVTVAGREAAGLAERFSGVQVRRLDLLDASTIPPALEGIEVAFYLAHSMSEGEAGFSQRDRQAAGAFGAAAARAGVQRIVYLGGLGRD